MRKLWDKIRDKLRRRSLNRRVQILYRIRCHNECDEVELFTFRFDPPLKLQPGEELFMILIQEAVLDMEEKLTPFRDFVDTLDL